MLMEVKNTVKFLGKSIFCNLKSAAEYKKSFWIQTIFMFINNGFFLIFWSVVFDVNGGEITGISMKNILYLWSIPTLAWGISNFLFGGIGELNRLIITGNLDTFLLQPKNVLLNLATSKCNFFACGDILYGLVISLVISESFLMFVKILFYSFLGTIFFSCTFIIVRSLSIWFGDVENVAHVYEQSLLLTLTTYPEPIFGKVLKGLMYTIAPAAYIVHVPIKLLENFDFKWFVLLLLALVIYIIFAIMFFKQVLKKYESGNSMVLRG